MLTRILSSIIGIILLGYIVNTGGWIYFLAVALLNVIAIYELYCALNKIGIYTKIIPICVLTVMFLTAINFLPHLNYKIIPLSVVLLLIFIFLYGIIDNSKNHITDIAFSIFSFTYTTMMFMYFILTRQLSHGVIIVWWIFITTWLCDTGAFFTGIKFGKNKLVPNISPHKTVEGSIGGIVFSAVGSFLFSSFLIPEISFVDALLVGLIIGVCSQIGDLSASLIKRYCHIKDFSNIIPGHGGILDRFDSALFSFPAAYYYIIMFIQKGGLF